MATESGTKTVVIKSNQLVAASQITGKYNKLPIAFINGNKYQDQNPIFLFLQCNCLKGYPALFRGQLPINHFFLK